MKQLIRIILLSLILCQQPTLSVFAQSAASRYAEGVSLYNKERYQDAISLFNEAMILNKNAENKKKCQQMIAKCKKALTNKNKSDVGKVSIELKIDRDTLFFDGNRAGADVVGITPANSWVSHLADPADSIWLHLEQRDDRPGFLFVNVTASDKTVSRSAIINIITENSNMEQKNVIVVQGRGNRPVLSVSPIEIDNIIGTGEIREISVHCTSDTLYLGRRNWTISEYPEWVTFLSVEAGKELPKDKLMMKFAENPNNKEREACVILQSQETLCKFVIKQKKGKKIRKKD